MRTPAFRLPSVCRLALAGLLAAETLPPISSPAADLVVQGANSPYAVTTGTASYDNIYVGQSASGELDQTGGTLSATTGQLFLGSNAGVTGTYFLNGGTLNTISTDVGDSGRGIFDLESGSHNVTGADGTANGSLDLAFYSGSNGTYNLDGGTLTAGYVHGNQGTSIFNFNGGALRAGASATDFFQGLTQASVKAGGAIISTNGFNVTIAQNLVSGTASGTVDGGLNKTGSGTLTLSGNNTYTGNTTVGAGTLAITGSVQSGAGARLRMTGGTLSLSGANSSISTGEVDVLPGGTLNQTGGTLSTNGGKLYVGGGGFNNPSTYNLNGGVLNVAAVAIPAPDPTQPAVLSLFHFGGGTLQASASTTTFLQGLTTVEVETGGASIDTHGYNVTVGQGLVSGVSGTDGGLTKLGSGTLTLSGANTYTGATTISAGTLQVGNGGTTGSLGTNTDAITNKGTLVFNHSDDITVANAITGNGGLAQAGSGTLTLSGANTYTGNTLVSGTGTLAITGSVQSGNGSVQGGIVTTLAVDSIGVTPGQPTATLSLSGAGSILSTNKAEVGIAGTGTVNQTGGSFSTNEGLFTLGEKAGSSGTYNLSGTGSILSTGTAQVGAAGLGTFNQSGGSFSANGFLYLGSGAGSGGYYNLSGGTLTTGITQVSDAANISVFNQTGGMQMVVSTLALSGGSAMSRGTYMLGGGVLQVGRVTGGDVNGIAGTSEFDFNGGTLQPMYSSVVFFKGLTYASVKTGGAIIDTNGYNVTVGQGLTSGVTNGTDGGLTKLGSGMLTLTGNNTFTGPLTISAGTLLAGSEASLGTGGTVTVGGGGTLGFTGSAATLTRTYNLGFSSLTATSGQTLTFGGGGSINGGFVGGPGTLAFGDGSTLNAATTTLNSTATVSGTVAFNNDALRGQITQTSGTINATDTVVSPSGTLVVGGTVNANGMEIDGVTTINNGGTLNGTAGSLVFGGGARATINAGGNLAAANGTTVELNGALLVNNGTQSGTLDVNYGSTAKGGGTFGTVNVADGGRFAVNATGAGGGSASVMAHGMVAAAGLTQAALVAPMLAVVPGTARVTSLSLGSGSIFALNVQDAQGTAGSGYDTARVSGVLTLNSSNTLGEQITISLVSLGANGAAGPTANFDASRSCDFVLASADGGISGYAPGEFVVDTTGFQNALDGGTFTVVQSGNNLDLMFNPVPEPSTWLLLGIGGIWLGMAVRRGCTG